MGNTNRGKSGDDNRDESIADVPQISDPEHTGYLWFYPNCSNNFEEPIWCEWHLQAQNGVLHPMESTNEHAETLNFTFNLRQLVCFYGCKRESVNSDIAANVVQHFASHVTPQQESISFECPPGEDRPFAINLRESPGLNQAPGRTLEFQAHTEEEWREWGLWIGRALSYRPIGINGPRSVFKRSQNKLEYLMAHVHDGHCKEVRFLTILCLT